MFHPMIERQLSPIGSLTLLPPIVAITVVERRQPRTWCGPNAYFSTSAPRRASGLASMESTHTSDQGSEVLEKLGPSWAGLFHNRGKSINNGLAYVMHSSSWMPMQRATGDLLSQGTVEHVDTCSAWLSWRPGIVV